MKKMQQRNRRKPASSLSHKGNLILILTFIAAKVSDALHLNRIWLYTKKILRMNKFIISQILSIRWIIEGIREKISKQHIYMQISLKHLIPYTEKKGGKYFRICSSQKFHTDKILLYQAMHTMVHTPSGRERETTELYEPRKP